MRASRSALRGSLPLCLLLAACGARSSLLGPGGAEGDAGSGGAGSSSTSPGGDSTSPGGAGGSLLTSCPSFALDGQPLSPTPILGEHTFDPWLAATELDGSRGGLVFIDHDGPQADSTFQVASVALDDPWGPWPSSLGASGLHGVAEGFVVGPNAGGRFSMLTTEEDCCGGAPVGMVVWSPEAGVSGAEGQFWNDVPPGLPLFVGANGSHYVAGYQRLLGDDLHHLTLAGVVFGGGPATAAATISACSLGVPLSGAALPLGGGFVLAQSNGRPFGKCLTDDLADGPASRLQIVTLSADTAQATLTFEADEPGTFISGARLAAAPGGAWAVWERVGFEPQSERRLQILRLDDAGLPVDGKILEVGWGLGSSPFAIASLGSLLALATMDVGDDDALTIAIRVLDQNGVPSGEAAFLFGPDLEVDRGVGLLAAPAGDRLLVTWSESSTVGDDARRVRLARLACTEL